MKLSFFQEPELEFNNGGTHVDIRYGVMRYGPLDLGDPSAPTKLRIGLVGTEETIAAIREWFDRCRTGVAGQKKQAVESIPSVPRFLREFAVSFCPPIS